MCELKPSTFSRISRLKPSTIATEASMTATERATAVTATLTAGELFLPFDDNESLRAK